MVIPSPVDTGLIGAAAASTVSAGITTNDWLLIASVISSVTVAMVYLIRMFKKDITDDHKALEEKIHAEISAFRVDLEHIVEHRKETFDLFRNHTQEFTRETKTVSLRLRDKVADLYRADSQMLQRLSVLEGRLSITPKDK